MFIQFARRTSVLLYAAVFILSAAAGVRAQAPARARAAVARSGGGGYEDLVGLFRYWREFQKPRLVGGIPDYTAAAMATQRRELLGYQRRLAAIDPTGWTVPQQVDYHIVRAEMNGLDFDHRVLQPWAKNPAFYAMIFTDQSDQPAREGPVAYGAIEVWQYKFPLAREDATELAAKIRNIPKVLDQAKVNLTGNARDLWITGTGSIREQSQNLDALGKRVAGTDANLEAEVRRAREATDQFAAWLEARAATKTGPSGIGVENYNWYLKNVHLVPYTWQDEVTMMQRELARSHASLKLEEERNRKLPPLKPVANKDEHATKFNAGVTEYMSFLRDNNVLTVRDYMDPALRARIGRFNAGPLEFFSEVDYRDRMVMLTHSYHWFDLARMVREPHSSPIRQGPLLYNMFDTRTEGFATAWEEIMLRAGMFDQHPRTGELVYILVAERAARALGDLMMHANIMTHAQGVKYASDWTPRGWLRVDGSTDAHEQHLYLQQPTYGTSYVMGKIQVEQMMADRARQLGDQFSLKRFMDEFNAVGLIPASLVRWELTGLDDEIKRMTARRLTP